MAENEAPERPRAVRLTIAYSGDRLELISQQSVAMKVPPSDPVESTASAAGIAGIADGPAGWLLEIEAVAAA